MHYQDLYVLNVTRLNSTILCHRIADEAGDCSLLALIPHKKPVSFISRLL